MKLRHSEPQNHKIDKLVYIDASSSKINQKRSFWETTTFCGRLRTKVCNNRSNQQYMSDWRSRIYIYIYTYDYTHIFMYIYIYMCVRVFYWTKGDASQLAEREREMPLLQSESVTPRATFGAFIILISSGMRIFTQKWTPIFSHFLHTRFPVSRFPKSWGKLQIIQVIRP